jgi:hypothetical protein
MKTIDTAVKIMSYSEPEAFPKWLEDHHLHDHDSKSGRMIRTGSRPF